MIVPDVKCVLGETLAMQDAWRRGFEGALSQRVLDVGAEGISSADERAEWTAKMEILSGGKNTIKWVNDGATSPKYFPTIMVKFPALRIRDLLENSTNNNLHPAFIVNGIIKPEIYIGKYESYIINSNNKIIGVSLYGVSPQGYRNFDANFAMNGNGGTGYHLITNAEWSMIALLAKNINMYQPKGNTARGRYYYDPESSEYYGVPVSMDSYGIMFVGSGTGPISWAHDGTPWGVYDMTGNLSEWCSGLRLAAGEIQIIPNNDAAVSSIDVSRDSPLWKAIKGTDGSLVTPEVVFASDTDTNPIDSGAGATLKYDATNPITVVTSISTRTTTTAMFSFYDDILGTNLPEIAASLCLAPKTPGGLAHGRCRTSIRNDVSGNLSEVLLLRGGYWWPYGNDAGMFNLQLTQYRMGAANHYGSRSAFVEL